MVNNEKTSSPSSKEKVKSNPGSYGGNKSLQVFSEFSANEAQASSKNLSSFPDTNVKKLKPADSAESNSVSCDSEEESDIHLAVADQNLKNLTQTILEDCDGESQGTSFSRVKRNRKDQLGKLGSPALVNMAK